MLWTGTLVSLRCDEMHYEIIYYLLHTITAITTFRSLGDHVLFGHPVIGYDQNRNIIISYKVPHPVLTNLTCSLNVTI